MMWVNTEKQEYINKKWNHIAFRRVNVFQCDHCNIVFRKKYKLIYVNSKSLTFCSKSCNSNSRSFGLLAQKWKQTKLEKYGVEFSSQIDGASEKMIKTRIERTGASSPSVKKSSSNEKFKATMMKRYNVEFPLQSNKIKNKFKQTFQKRYGISNPLTSKSPFRSIEGCIKGGQNGYRALVLKKGNDTISKPESLLCDLLVERFGRENVKQQEFVGYTNQKRFLVDFYISSLNVYVELDGIFWHGLDKPYNELHPKVKAKFDKDREQDNWFIKINKKLIRITDQELLYSKKLGDFSAILEKVGG